MAVAKNNMQKVLDIAGQFVTKQKGDWGHSEWEKLLAEVASSGYEINDKSRKSLGAILEASRGLYECMPKQKPRKRTVKKKVAAKK